MSIDKKYIPENNDCIETKDRSVLNYWCEKLAISPFALFHVIKTVGNNVTKIEEFLHNQSAVGHEETKNSLSLEVHN
jgi:hypothetical protein